MGVRYLGAPMIRITAYLGYISGTSLFGNSHRELFVRPSEVAAASRMQVVP